MTGIRDTLQKGQRIILFCNRLPVYILLALTSCICSYFSLHLTSRIPELVTLEEKVQFNYIFPNYIRNILLLTAGAIISYALIVVWNVCSYFNSRIHPTVKIILTLIGLAIIIVGIYLLMPICRVWNIYTSTSDIIQDLE